MRFTKIILKGFRSFVNETTFDLDRGGLWIIKGINGEGKTTIFSALTWAAYRVNLNNTINEKVATWSWLRPDDWQGTRVCLFGETEKADYMIVRHLDYKGNTYTMKGDSKLMIFRKEDRSIPFNKTHLLGTEHHKDDQQGYINRLLGVESKTFLNSILFGQRMKRIIDSEAKDKREVFESVFDVAFVEAAKENGKNKLADKNSDIAVSSSKIEAITDFIAADKEQHASQKLIGETFETDQAARIKALLDDSNVIYKKYKESKEERDAQKKLADKYDVKKETELKSALSIATTNEKTILAEQEAADRDVKSAKRSLDASSTKLAIHKQNLLDIATNCPVCQAPLTAEKLDASKKELDKLIKAEELVEKELLKLYNKNIDSEKAKAAQLVAAKAETGVAQAAFDKYVESVDKYKKSFDSLHLYEDKVNDLEEQLTKVEANIKKEKEVQPPKIELTAITARIENGEREIALLNKRIIADKAEAARLDWWIKKGFGAGGLKSFVFSAMLNQLNIHLEKYASRLGLGVEFSIDLTKASKPFIATCFMDGHGVDYEEISGGQKQRVDICIAFAMHDLVIGANPFNILILDEVFEGLDEAGVKIVFDLIRLKATKDQTVFVITHSKFVDMMQAKKITVARENKLSYIS